MTVAIVDQRTVRVLITVLLFVAGCAFIWTAWKMLLVFLFSIFFAYLIEPFVLWISRHFRVSRGAAIGIVYLGVFAGLGVLLFFIGPAIVHEGEKLSEAAPELYNKIASGNIAWQIGSQHGWSHATQERIQHFLATHRDSMLDIAEQLGARLAKVGANAWYLVLIPILAVFFVKDGEKIGKSIAEFFERRRQREFIDALLSDIHIMLAQYIRTQLMLSGIAMCVYLLFLSIMRVPYAAAIAVVAGMLEFIPVVGPLVAAVLVIGIPLAAGYGKILYLVIFLAIWRGAQDYVITPRVMGGKLSLSPMAALFGVLVGAEIGGIVGVYLSIPIMATIRIIWHRWRDYRVDDHLATVTTTLATVERDKTA